MSPAVAEPGLERELEPPARLDPAGRYIVVEFESLAEAEGFELVDGTPVEKGMGSESGLVNGNLHATLGHHVRAHKLGFVLDSDSGYVLFPDESDKVRKPDLSFVARGRFPDDRPPRGFARLAPDFAFESVSPSDLAEGLHEKVEEYLAAGVRLIWVAYPSTRVVLEFRADGSIRRYPPAATLAADDLFPGFACPVADLFAGL